MSQIDRYKQRQRTKKLRELSKSFSGGAGVRENIRAAREAVRTLQIQTGMSTEEVARKIVQARTQIEQARGRLSALRSVPSTSYRPGLSESATISRIQDPVKAPPRGKVRAWQYPKPHERTPRTPSSTGGHLPREIAEFAVRGKRR